MKRQKRVIVSKERLEELLKRLKSRDLKPEDYELLEGMAETWEFLCTSLEQKKLSIKRLQQILFGSKSEKSEKISAQVGGTDSACRPGEDPSQR